MTRPRHFRTTYHLEREPVSYELDVDYTFFPARPEQGPTYSCGGQPAEDAEIEITKIESDQKQGAFELTDEEAGELLDWLFTDAFEQIQEELDARAEYLFEQRRDQ